MTASNPLGDELMALLTARFPESEATHVETLPPRESQHAAWPSWVLPALRAKLVDASISAPYAHQAQLADAAWAGRDAVIATGTSSGKSLGYQLPILTRLAEDSTTCALYLTPTKALGSDQLHAVMNLVQGIPELRGVAPAPYDGDTPQEARAGIRDHSRFIFTNPDMLHMSLLAAHQRWARVLRHLEFIVIDECHSYRGVFGANVALVLRRLLRLCEHYGAHPVVLLASATMKDPARHAARLTGRPAADFVEVTEDGAPTGARTVALWEPGFVEGAEGQNGAPVRRAATTEAAGIMATLIAEGARTLTFVRSRRNAEMVSLRTQEELSGRLGRPDFAQRIAAYRAGYLAEDRRALEKSLDDGSLLGVATTSALELGIDVGGLDAVVTAGFPGTVASFWQQAGRAGRRGQGSLVVLVARDEPMDTYLVHHPEALLGRPVEASVFNPENPYILYGHVYCAAIEKPLQPADIEAWGAEGVVRALEADGLIRRRERGWFAVPLPAGSSPVTPENAHAQVSLRGGSGEEVMIVDHTTGRLLGTIDAARAAGQVHPGAVYLHLGESYVVDELDFGNYVALVHPEIPNYTTQPRSTTDIRILSQADGLVNYSPGLWVANLEVEVTDAVTGYQVRFPDGTVGDDIPLDMPEQTLRTRAVAYTIDPLVLAELGINAAAIPGTLHAAEHAAIGLLPLIATCDRWDIGGVSTALHMDTQLPTVFVYDGHPGGAGFADEGFRRFPEWIEATYEAVRSCPCESGCPSCVQSPKCGNGNNPLDKAGAIELLGALVAMTANGPVEPEPVDEAPPED
ncbi:putative DEAH-box helicase [Corynebacterium sp. CMW7794]|uniref:DEAD/DEAH box helicase n=1 Tax=unclassified Corynebacterium TaxID=2624378 RepID=UPI00079B8030|nr:MULTISPECIES: DEAD/DEAH box helicase [unclassified Corynebacterium]KXB54573.1 putative DEAH-box helicase [Corynebacterium sp. DNF00584]KXI19528.1 putative DEAH-box helicase [Corynebacterium sp. CMW7794]OFL77099.1 DEAD/DEAH box helicase [Corynebacterium sp. HMSC077B05]OFN43298.1 DEAD/DEAH box helicase [Corynebacterium sp. HMSC072G08]OFP19059.1 DEAD/DEAH box helicase [Corynebacterium sp. HMSC065A05]